MLLFSPTGSVGTLSTHLQSQKKNQGHGNGELSCRHTLTNPMSSIPSVQLPADNPSPSLWSDTGVCLYCGDGKLWFRWIKCLPAVTQRDLGSELHSPKVGICDFYVH